MNNRRWLAGIAALALLSVLTLGARNSPTGGGGGSGKAPNTANTGGDITVDFAAAGPNACTLALSKGAWRELVTVSPGALWTAFVASDGTGDFKGERTLEIWVRTIQTCEIQSDPRVLKVTFARKDAYMGSAYTGSFKIKLTGNNTFLGAALVSETGIPTADRAAFPTGAYKPVTVGTNEPVTVTIE